MSSRTLSLDDRLYDYLLANSLREPAVLAELRAETGKMAQGMMQISPEQGQFMQLLARLLGAKRCIEIGTFTGYSSLAVALALPADGRILCCDVSEEFTQVARRYWAKAGVADKITLALGPAVATLDAMLAKGDAGRFDMAFIDADKASYDAYYERCLRLLWSGDVADPAKSDADTQAIRALNAKLAKDERVDLSLLPVGDGLTLARKR
jgi:predicted O-methyltransferase YrrM